jgi:adenylyltransferase/sulfurtransferase
VADYDLVADDSDNFTTRHLADACFLARKPLVTAALGVFDGFSDDDPRPRKKC